VIVIKTKLKKNIKRITVISFLVIYILATIISLRGSYLEYKELGENFLDVFYTNTKYKYIIFGANFLFLFIVMLITNKKINKSLKIFFEKEKKEIPKLANKSIALIISILVTLLISNILLEKIILVISNTSFEIADPIFNLDISFYMFIRPIIKLAILYYIYLTVGLTIYITIYHIIVFNIYFDGIDREILKTSNLIKIILRNVIKVAVGIGLLNLLNVQNVLTDSFLTLENGVELVGAGFTEATISLWGYVLFTFVIVFSAIYAVKYFKANQSKKVIGSILSIPLYLVTLFLVITIYDVVFINSNEYDKEKQYIEKNIEYTKRAYDINIEQQELDYSGTITIEENEKYEEVIRNIPVVNKNIVLETLKDTKTEAGYYNYRNANIAKYKIDGKDMLVYVSPREITNENSTYNNKTYEFTHGYGEIIISATSTDESGNIHYIQKELNGEDNQILISQPRIYFGLETDNIIATNAKNIKEYDYTENGKDIEYSYKGEAGLSLNFIDRLILAIKEKNLNLAFSSNINKESKILINRNIIQRAKLALPYLKYDDNPYTVVDSTGNIYWILDAYTMSDKYPYSTYTTVINDNTKKEINYIRNSVKVIINAYTGEMKFFITDRNDPIAMAYRNIYTNLFEDLDAKIPEDISEKFIYPQYLYNIQAKMISTYHNVKPDILYRNNDLWDMAKYNTNQTAKTNGIVLKSYYTTVKTINNDEELGLVQMYTPNNKSNIISYLVGTCEGTNNNLKIYKFASDSSILGATQLDKQIEQDETIKNELQALNVIGTKITKDMIIVPIDNTLLFVQTIYQTMTNESDVPKLKKVIVASGNKVAIGNTLQESLQNLLSQYAVNIEIVDTDNIEDLIDEIIKANNNLKQSNASDNWELIGTDIKNLQELIDSLEILVEEQEKTENKENEQLEQDTEKNVNEITNSIENSVLEE